MVRVRFPLAVVGLGCLVSQASVAASHKHTFCYQPASVPNVTFGGYQTFRTAGSPNILLTYASNNTGGDHVKLIQGLDIVADSTGAMGCQWINTDAQISEGRVSGCSASYEDTVIFAGGHNNSAAYVGPVDVFSRQNGGVVHTATYQLPVGRELLGCTTNGNITVFAGGKPPHPPSPIGETTEIDVWDHTSNKWSIKNLSVERKKVEAVSVADLILMAGGEIGHHPPAPAPRGRVGVQGYSSSVDILNVSSMEMSTAELQLARQYFAVAVANGKAFFGGGFANDVFDNRGVSAEIPLAGFRSNLVDIFDAKTNTWSTAHLSTNRSNLMGTAVLDRYVLFAGGTRQEPTADLCGTLERSAVVDIYDTVTDKWSTDCLHNGRTSLYAVSVGATAVFFGGTTDPIDLFTFPASE